MALLLPFAAGAAADNTALVATAGLLVRQLMAALSRPGWMAAGAGAVGAVAGGGCGTPIGNDAGGGKPMEAATAGTILLLVLFVNAKDWLLFGDVMRGVEIGCDDVEIAAADIDADAADPNPLASGAKG